MMNESNCNKHLFQPGIEPDFCRVMWKDTPCEAFKEAAGQNEGTREYIDENGDKQEYDETFYMNGESITIPQMTQEQVDKAVNYILSLKKSGYDNTNVMNIINEEMGGFFTGQKSAQEVAAVIQNRVQLYVDENR